MSSIPNQVKAIDPYSELRYSNNYNLRTRMLTQGQDCVVYLESFDLTKSGDYNLSIGPGIAIKDDIMIHIYQSVTISTNTDQGYMFSGDGEPPNITPNDWVYLFLDYAYSRSIPAPKASYKLLRDLSHYTTSRYMYLGKIYFDADRKISIVSQEAVANGDEILKRNVLNPLTGYTMVNGGNVRKPAPNTGDVGWYEQWEVY